MGMPSKECPTGKRSYPSEGRAKAALKNLRNNKGKVMAYFCKECYQWHLGSTLNPNPPKKRREGNRKWGNHEQD